MSKVEEMIEYLPSYYANSKQMNAIIQTEGSEFDEFKKGSDDVLDQLFVDTATWGLEKWERLCEIPTELSKPIDQRRSVVKSKLRGIGKVDVYLIKNVADAYTNADVIVSFDGRIGIKFTSSLGIPPNIENLKKAIEEIKPAHLGVNYDFRYLLVRDIHEVMTINELQMLSLDKFAGGESNG